ncbi:MAG: 1-(5-phosphoribosyl)-5-[(5-phosphoribosylamino)methylideneamino]imidazole-4-carboxamide isomerase [Nitrospirae bacterium]|nr:1-(5-phosphoribosyl)-5-[(5-phosphoribosylamino)methylideneamino]imidazole-4-carboxamide isomerase [Nitrospirota bacterium]
MIVIPAIDIKDGKCVRLLQGRKEEVTVYSEDPVFIAKQWVNLGAELLHVVDLDGAFTGKQKNSEVITAMRKAINIPIQVGGGIRNLEGIERLIASGIDRVILSTVTIENPEVVKEACKKYPGQILVSIDAKGGLAAVKGWVEVTGVDAKGLALKMQEYGIAGIIYTDISKDGMLTGPNIEAIREMVENLKIPVIASGGVSSIKDIKRLAEIKRIWGVITGKALYEGTLDLKEAIKITMQDA